MRARLKYQLRGAFLEEHLSPIDVSDYSAPFPHRGEREDFCGLFHVFFPITFDVDFSVFQIFENSEICLRARRRFLGIAKNNANDKRDRVFRGLLRVLRCYYKRGSQRLVRKDFLG